MEGCHHGGTTGRLFGQKEAVRLETLLFGLGELLLCAFAVIFMVKRVQHGIDFSDEAWYIADPYVVAKGLIPYVNDLSDTPGFTLPLAIPFGIYTAIMGTEGIFLFSRYLYLVWMFSVGIVVMLLVRKEIDRRFPIIAWLPVSQMFFLYDINYNTIGTVYLPLILALLYAGWNRTEDRAGSADPQGLPHAPSGPAASGRQAFRYAVLAGIVGARAIIGSPFLIVPGLLVLAFLLITKKRGLLRGVLLGFGLIALLVTGWCCLRGSAERLIYGLYVTLKDFDYFHQGREVTYSRTLYLIWAYSLPALRFTGAAVVLRLILRRREKTLRAALIALSLGFMISGLFTPRWAERFSWLIFNCFFECLILLLIPGEGKKHLGLCGIALIYYLMYVTSSLGNIWGVIGREYWLIVPCVLSFYALYIAIPFRVPARAAFTVLLTGFFLIQCWNSWNYVHRDAPIPEHTATVPSGIWKGAKTTEERARLVTEMEACIRGITEPGDKVMFRDWVSYAYVMSDGQFCSTSPLNSCSESYNDATFLYDLFYSEQTVPDKIIYLSAEGEKLSIENEGIVFNSFVHAFYEPTFTCEGEGFRVLEYDLRDGSAALAYASANASRLPWRS